jgi:hypothetical protein
MTDTPETKEAHGVPSLEHRMEQAMNTNSDNGSESPSEKLQIPLRGPDSLNGSSKSKIPKAWRWHLRTLLDLREQLLKVRDVQAMEAAGGATATTDQALLHRVDNSAGPRRLDR